MRAVKLGAIAILVTGVCIPASANDVQLKGNAVADARLEFNGTCYIAHNNSGTRRIKFGLGNTQAIVDPKQTHTFVDLGGHCFTSFFPGGPWANYAS
jgi:hypothetical protein